MGMTATDLAQHRDAQLGTTEKKDGSRTDRILKMFPSEDKIKAIKADTKKVTLGHGENELVVTVYPMSPKQMVQAYGLIRQLILPIIGIVMKQNVGQQIAITDILDAFGENVDKLPELIFYILSRGNQGVTQEWVNDHFDLVLDMQAILPPFLEQNGLGKLFAGNGSTVAAESVKAQVTQEVPPQTEESQVQSPSFADGMVGAPT